MGISDAMLDALDKAGPEARRAFFAKRTPEERQALAEAIPKWRESKPSALESYARGAWQTGTAGFADEAEAGLRALAGVVTSEPGTVLERYQGKRDKVREEYRRAEEAHPDATTAGKVAGGIATAFIPGLGPAKGLGGAVKMGAALGAAQGLGESEADLTKGEVGGAAKDAALGGVLGGVAGGVAHGIAAGVGKVAGKIAGRGARGVADAEVEEATKQGLLQAKREASALGKYRSGVQSASRDLEVLARESADLPEGTLKREAQAYLQSPEGLALREIVAGNKLGTAPERLAEMAQLRAEHGALVAGREGLVKQATEEALADPLRKQFAPRLATLGHRLIPAALAGLGGIVGGPGGAAAGAGLGGVVALSQGRPGIIIRNLIRSPAARRSMWGLVQRVATVSPEALGRFGGAIAGALRRGNTALAEALHERALAADEEYQSGLLRVLEQAGGESGMSDAGGAE